MTKSALPALPNQIIVTDLHIVDQQPNPPVQLVIPAFAAIPVGKVTITDPDRLQQARMILVDWMLQQIGGDNQPKQIPLGI